MKSKNPIFLEAVDVNKKGEINYEKLNSVTNDYDKYIDKSLFAVQESIFNKENNTKSLKEGFEEIEKWIKEYYNVNN
jgi:CRISPR-associated protein Cst2